MSLIAQYIAFVSMLWAAVNAFQQNSVGWGTVAICGSIYLAVWSISEQIARGLNRLDEIAAGLKRSGLLRDESEDDDIDDAEKGGA
jgi:hypothetical protein